MNAVLAVLLLVLLRPSGSTLDLLSSAQIAPGTESAQNVLAGRVHFKALRNGRVPEYSWIRLSLKAAPDASGSEWVLFLPSSVDRGVAYIPADRGYSAHRLGIGLPWSQHAQPYLRPAVELDDPALQGTPVYLHVHYFPDTPFYLRAVTEADAIVLSFEMRMMEGLFFGVLLAIGLCNLYVAIAVREKAAGFFVLYIAAFAVNELVTTGLGSQYLWPHAAPDLRALTLLTNTFTFLAGLLFARSFLQTRIMAPKWDRLLIAWFIAEASVDTLRHALPNGMAMAPLLLAIQLSGMLITVGAGIVRIRQGFGPARFFVLAFMPAMAGYMANIAYDIYMPPGRWFFAANGVEFGAMFESIIFSFSLLDRIRTLDAANVKLRDLATRDPLTRLFNRTAFFERFDSAIRQARSNKTGLGVLYVDLDGFKSINDRYGHRTGDLLLQIVARRLRMTVRESDTIARLGGDEFAILVTHVNSPEVLETVRADVNRLAETPLTIEGHVVRVGISVGGALFPRDGDGADRLIEAADRAMYAAKQARPQAPETRGSTTPA